MRDFRLSRRVLLLAAALLCSTETAFADGGASMPRYQQVTPSRDGIGKTYMGREIAGVMGWQAAAWLERENRERE